MNIKTPLKLPKPCFKSIYSLDRYKRILMGLPIYKARAGIPWGYSQDPENPDNLIPDVNSLRLLFKAKEYLKTCSFLEVARWLSAETKTSISHEGLRKILIDRCPLPEILLPYEERERIYLNPTKHDSTASKPESNQEECFD